jgi:hypothetical protein
MYMLIRSMRSFPPGSALASGKQYDVDVVLYATGDSMRSLA